MENNMNPDAKALAIPRVNMNGNSNESLVEQLTQAHASVQTAITALANADYAHGRNYQTIPNPQVAQNAIEEHRERLQALISVRDDLMTLAIEINNQ
jgi:hypothetical protein